VLKGHFSPVSLGLGAIIVSVNVQKMTGASHFQNSTGMRRGKFWCRGARCPAKLVFAGEMMMEIQFSVIELSPRAVWGKLSL